MIKADNFLEKFKKLFEDTDPNLINLNTHFKNLDEWNSLIILSLIVMCEDEFNTHISPSEIEKAILVSDLFEYARLNKKNA